MATFTYQIWDTIYPTDAVALGTTGSLSVTQDFLNVDAEVGPLRLNQDFLSVDAEVGPLRVTQLAVMLDGDFPIPIRATQQVLSVDFTGGVPQATQQVLSVDFTGGVPQATQLIISVDVPDWIHNKLDTLDLWDTVVATRIAAPVMAAVVVDKTSDATRSVLTTASWGHVCEGNDRALLVGVVVSGTQTVQSATHHGKALSYLGTANDDVGSLFRTEIWGLANPDSDADAAVVVTMTDVPTDQLLTASISLADCDPAPFGIVITENARTGTVASVDVADGESGDLVVAFAGCEEGFVEASQTVRLLYNVDGSNWANNMACATAVVASPVTMSFTVNNGGHSVGAVKVKKKDLGGGVQVSALHNRGIVTRGLRLS